MPLAGTKGPSAMHASAPRDSRLGVLPLLLSASVRRRGGNVGATSSPRTRSPAGPATGTPGVPTGGQRGAHGRRRDVDGGARLVDRCAARARRAGRLTGALLDDVVRGANCRGVCGSASRPLGVRQRSPGCAPQRRHGRSSQPLARSVIGAAGRDRLCVSMQRLPAGAPQVRTPAVDRDQGAVDGGRGRLARWRHDPSSFAPASDVPGELRVSPRHCEPGCCVHAQAKVRTGPGCVLVLCARFEGGRAPVVE